MYVLHACDDTASLIVRLVLCELGVEFDCHQIDREGGELDSPAYRAMQPLGLIPALETPDGPMFETAAILLYLADRYPGLAPAPSDPDRAAFLSWFVFTNNSIHTTLLQLFYPHRTAGEDCAAAVATEAAARMQTYLGLLNDRAAMVPGWLTPAQPSVLGYYVAVLMRWLASSDPSSPAYFATTDYPALHAVLAALETRPAALTCAAIENLGSTIFTNPAS